MSRIAQTFFYVLSIWVYDQNLGVKTQFFLKNLLKKSLKIVINPVTFYFLVFSWPILGPKNAALDGEFFAKNRLAGSYTVEELAWGVCKGVFRRLPTSGTCNSHLDSHNDLIDHIFPSKSTMGNTNFALPERFEAFFEKLDF